MKHMFDIDVATKYGIEEAVILDNMLYWVKKNAANRTHFYDGSVWTYNSIKAFTELFPYLSKSKIEYAINNLIKYGLIITGNYNKLPMDRTKWYSLTDKAYEELKEKNPISEFSEMDLLKSGNGFLKIQEPIPDVNSNITADINNDSSLISSESIEKKDINSSDDSFISKEKPKRSAGIMPSKEEVDAYIAKKGYHFSSEEFLKYYTNDGELDVLRFKDGKLVKDWHRCCVTFEDNWKRRNGDKPAYTEAKPFNQFETDWDDPELQRARKKQMERAAERRRLRSEQQPAV